MPDTDSPQSNIPQVLAIISRIEAERAARNFDNLDTTILWQLMAELLSEDKDEQRLIAYAYAVHDNLAPTSEERIEDARRAGKHRL